MDKTQNSFLSLYSPQDFRLTLNKPLVFQGVAEDWALKDWSPSDYDLLICLEGEAFYYDGDREYHMLPGRALLARPEIPLASHLGEKRVFHVLAQHFLLTLGGGRDFLSLINGVFFGSIRRMTLVGEYLDLIQGGFPGSFLIHDLFRVILWDFLEGAGGENFLIPKRDPLLDCLREIAQFIGQRSPDENELEVFLRRLPYSPVYLRDSFREHFGRTPKQYLNDRKMERARILLKEGYSVKETARLTGFKDELYFARVFKKHNRLSPGRFGRSEEM